jgi:trigger factor
LAQTVGDYETLDALKNEIRGELLTAAKRQTEDKYSDECVDALVKQATVEFAPQMIKAEIDELVERTERRLKDQKMDMAQYLEALGKTEEQYREELKPTAEVRLRRGLALAEFTKLESITVSDEAIEQQIDRLAASYGPQSKEARKALSSEGARDSIKIDLVSRAGLERLMAICKGEAPADRPVDTL